MDAKKAFELMQNTLDSMQRSGVMEKTLEVSSNTVILGSGSPLDSLGFVTFISDLEERISTETGKEHYLVLTEIHEANAEEAFLSAGTLAKYIEGITG